MVPSAEAGYDNMPGCLCNAQTLPRLRDPRTHSVMAQVWLVVSSAPEKRPAISGVNAARDSGSPVPGSTMRFRQPHMLLSFAATGPRACARPGAVSQRLHYASSPVSRDAKEEMSHRPDAQSQLSSEAGPSHVVRGAAHLHLIDHCLIHRVQLAMQLAALAHSRQEREPALTEAEKWVIYAPAPAMQPGLTAFCIAQGSRTEDVLYPALHSLGSKSASDADL